MEIIKKTPCIWQFKSKDKLARTILKHQKGIQLVSVFPKEAPKKERGLKWVWSHATVDHGSSQNELV